MTHVEPYSTAMSGPRKRGEGQPRRLARVVLTLAIVTGITVVVSPSARPAGADQISSDKAQAAQIASQIASLNSRIDALSQAYDAATYKLHQIDAQIAQTRQQIAQDQSKVSAAHTKLRQQAIRAYMTAGSTTTLSQYFSTDGSTQGISNEYTTIADGNVTTTIDVLHTATRQLQAAQTQLAAQQSQAASQQQSIANSRSQATALVDKQQATLNGLNGQIATLVKQQQAAQQAAAAAAARAQFQASLAASQAATGGGGPSPGSVVPPISSGAAGAVQAAESQLGVPYQWGAESPGHAFDCSGLTAWAWGMAGHPLPHYSGAQYDDTVHIPLSAMQPGDLLFYGPGGSEHVAMYIGGGMMVEAPYTGAHVWNTPVRTGYGFAGVGRVQ